MPFPLIIIGGCTAVAGAATWFHRNRKKPQVKARAANEVSTTECIKLKPLVEQHQHDIEQRQHETDKDFKISLLAMGTTGLSTLAFPSLLAVAVPLVLYNSAPIFRDAWVYWRDHRKFHSSIIDSVAITGTLATGFYFSATIINTFYFLGQKVLLKTEDNSSQKLMKLFGNNPRHVWLWHEGTATEIETPVEHIETGQTVVVHSGESIAFDGHIISGTATIDQHMLTGESRPQEKHSGDNVFASTLVLSGNIHIRVDKAGKDTAAAQISEALQNTLDFKSSVEAKGTRVANQMALPTLALSGLALIKLGPVGASAIANCNFADIIRITVPLGVLNHLKIAAEQGVLVKDGRALELLGSVDTVIFDKTGTLTEETPEIDHIHACNGYSENQVLSLSAAAENYQTHPVARAIQAAAAERNPEPLTAEHIHYEPGYGLKADIAQQSILLGSLRFMQAQSVTLPEKADYANEGAYSLVYLAVNGELAGILSLRAKIRPEVPAMISCLKKRGLELCILSGDHEQPTRQLAETLGITQYQAETLPEDKAGYIEALQADGHKVCFIGDGINDAIAMKKAQVAISLAGATTVATDTAGIVLLDKSLVQLDPLFSLARGFERNMKSGMAWSLLPGVVGIGAVFALHMRIYGAVGLYLLSLGAGTVNASLPLLKHDKNKPVLPER